MVFSLLNAQNNCLDFDGTEDYVNIADADALDLTASYTIEAWIYPESFDYLNGIVSKYQTGSSLGYTLRLIAGSPYSGVDFDGLSTASGILSVNNWYHIAAVNNEGTRTLYVNGIAQSTSGTAQTTAVNNDPVNIGRDFESRYFDGKIDEVRIWNDARSETEIRSNMYQEIASPGSDLIAYYKLNESDCATTAIDTKESYNGTLTNMTGNEWETSPAFFGPKNCLDFDGGSTGNYDYAYKTSNVTSSTDDFTMMAWAKPDVLTGWRCIAYNGDDDGGYGIGIEGDKVAGLFGTQAWHITSEALPTTGVWYHITMRRSSGTVQFFLNGKLISYSDDTPPNTPNSKFTIGNMYDTDGSTLYGDSFDGQIDEVRVYDAALNDQQIRENMCNSLIGDEDDLVAYYNFDNSTGTTLQAFDGSTTNDLTLVNMSNDDWASSTAFNTWLDVGNITWATATNWSRGSVPVLTDNVGIPDYTSVGSSQPTIGSAAACNNLVVGDDATLTFDYNGSHTIHGSAFVIGRSDITNGDFLTVTKNLYILFLSSLNIDPEGQLTIGNNLD
ncbi:MAG: LamG domain-containing protein, partial [Mariniphaga sp.]|nr:LamG domain-containing protein [Mariniphaga sp.]